MTARIPFLANSLLYALLLYACAIAVSSVALAQTASETIAQYEADLKHARELRDRAAEALALSNLGVAYESTGQRRKALEFLNDALPIMRELGDRRREAATLSIIGVAYKEVGQPQKALEFYDQALPVWREVGERTGEADTLYNVGVVYEDFGQPQRALEFYNQALVIERDLGDRSNAASTLSNIGKVYQDTGQPQKALEFYNHALSIEREVGDNLGEANTLNNIGMVYSDVGQPSEALESFDQAAMVDLRLGDSAMASTLNNMGDVYRIIGQPFGALMSYKFALSLQRKAGDRGGEAMTLSNIGRAYLDIGVQPQTLLEDFDQTLLIQREVGDRGGEASTLNNIGKVHQDTGQPQRALEFFDQALVIERDLGDRRGEASTLNNIGKVYQGTGQPRKSLEFYNQALRIQREADDRRGEVRTLLSLAKLGGEDSQLSLAELGGEDQQLSLAKLGGEDQQLSLAELGGEDQQLSLAELGGEDQQLSLTELVGEDPLPTYLAAMELAERASDLYDQADISTSVMRHWADTNPSLAILFGKAAVNNYQEIRGNLRGLNKEFQPGFAQSKEETYRRLAELLIQKHRLAMAEQVLDALKEEELKEKFRADARRESGASTTLPLTESECKARSGIASQEAAAGNPVALVEEDLKKAFRASKESGAPPTTLPFTESERKAMAEIASQEAAAGNLIALAEERDNLQAKAEPAPADQSRLKELSEHIAEGNKAIRHFFDVTLFKELATLETATEESGSIRSELQQLPVGTVAIYTLAMDQHTYLLLITPSKHEKREATLFGRELSEKVLTIRDELKNPRSSPQKHLKELYAALIAPVLPDLQAVNAHTILWSLDGVLRYVPLGALYDGTEYFVEQGYDNVLITPASRNHLLDAAKPTNWSLLAMGLSKGYLGASPLVGVHAELNAIVHDPNSAGSHGPVPGRLLENDAFTLAAIEDLSSKFEVVHLATHVIYDSSKEPSLLLAGEKSGEEGYQLTASKMSEELEFKGVKLLTLSACSTALPDQRPTGTEMESLGMIAQQNGAAAVISTLWDVNDVTTSLLMSDFYSRWLGAKPMPKVEALRRAQLDLLHGNATAGFRYAHPYYWAPFVLIGNFQ